MRRLASAALVAAMLVPALAACNDDKKDGASVTAGADASIAPEDLRTSATAVATGLQKIVTISASIAVSAATDKDKATADFETIEPVWSQIEGTVKDNDSETYLTLEDNFALLENAAKDGDGAKAASASVKISAAVTAYLAKHPA